MMPRQLHTEADSTGMPNEDTEEVHVLSDLTLCLTSRSGDARIITDTRGDIIEIGRGGPCSILFPRKQHLCVVEGTGVCFADSFPWEFQFLRPGRWVAAERRSVLTFVLHGTNLRLEGFNRSEINGYSQAELTAIVRSQLGLGIPV